MATFGDLSSPTDRARRRRDDHQPLRGFCQNVRIFVLPAVAAVTTMDPLEWDQAVLDGERPLEHDRPNVALAGDGAPRFKLNRGDPDVLNPSESAPSTRGKGEVSCRRRAPG